VLPTAAVWPQFSTQSLTQLSHRSCTCGDLPYTNINFRVRL